MAAKDVPADPAISGEIKDFLPVISLLANVQRFRSGPNRVPIIRSHPTVDWLCPLLFATPSISQHLEASVTM